MIKGDFWKDAAELAAMRENIPVERRAMSGIQALRAYWNRTAKSSTSREGRIMGSNNLTVELDVEVVMSICEKGGLPPRHGAADVVRDALAVALAKHRAEKEKAGLKLPWAVKPNGPGDPINVFSVADSAECTFFHGFSKAQADLIAAAGPLRDVVRRVVGAKDEDYNVGGWDLDELGKALAEGKAVLKKVGGEG